MPSSRARQSFLARAAVVTAKAALDGGPGSSASRASKGGGGPSRLLQRGYERLLELECVPERARDAGATLGKIERIRIRW